MTGHTEILQHLHDAGLHAPYLEKLAAYSVLLLDANRRFNLTGAKTPADLAPHLLDSLSLLPYMHGRLVDVGSGGGLPAIPLAIATGRPVVMIESVAKKAAFLQAVLAELELPGDVLPMRAEVAGHDPSRRGAFDSGTARAVSTAPTVAELLLPLLAVGGRAVLQRGNPDERELDALTDATLMLGGRLCEEHRQAGDRRLVILEKIGETPLRFPRRTGVPEKRPLCLP